MTRSHFVSSFKPVPTSLRVAVVVLAGSLAGCSTIEGWFSSDKVDYRTKAKQTEGLQVPPDLNSLDNRSLAKDGTVSATKYEQEQQQRLQGVTGTPAPAGTSSAATASAERVALNAVGDMHIERDGNARWLHSSLTPEQLWPKVQTFWTDGGFEIASAKADVGVIETNWREDRSKLPQDPIRSMLGKVFDGLYSTGKKDQYMTRLERSPKGGTDIFVVQHGIEEVYTSSSKDNTTWQPRPNDPQLEALMLSRLMLQLGGKDVETASVMASAASDPAAAASASTLSAMATHNIITGADESKTRPLSAVPDQIVVADGFDRTWRRVGLTLDRRGFTIEDRDRTQGLFYLRYADPSKAGEEEPNFFQRLFGAKQAATGRYRVAVRTEGDKSTVLVLDNTGKQVTDENAKRILNLLMDDLR